MSPNLSRKQRRAIERENNKRTEEFKLIPKSEWPINSDYSRSRVFVNSKFLVQEFIERDCIRLSISRTSFNKGTSDWSDNISWDELQKIKRDIGFGNMYAIEIYPRDIDIVNVANIRHLWVFKEPLSIGWFK